MKGSAWLTEKRESEAGVWSEQTSQGGGDWSQVLRVASGTGSSQGQAQVEWWEQGQRESPGCTIFGALESHHIWNREYVLYLGGSGRALTGELAVGRSCLTSCFGLYYEDVGS